MKTLPTLALGVVSLAVFSGCATYATPWFDRDKPSGVGEYETTRDLLKIECRFKAAPNATITQGSPAGYHCNVAEGGWCRHNEPPGLQCRDMEVRFTWAGGATPWLDRDKPSGVGEYETTKGLLKIECRFKAAPNAIITEGSPVGYHCNVTEGGWCKNNVPPGFRCGDMEVRFTW